MFGTLILKEIRESIQTSRFLIAVVLCLLFLPMGMLITTRQYERQLTEYNDAVRLYLQNSEGSIGLGFRAEGYRPPSWKSIFSTGLEQFLPKKALTSNTGRYTIVNEADLPNPHSLLFGKIDYQFIVGFVLSLLALIYTFNSISGEKEAGTLRLIMSNSVSRSIVLSAKILGNFIAFLAPFFVALLVGFLLLGFQKNIAMFSGDSSIAIMLIVLTSVLFMAVLFTLGVFVSSFTSHSITSMVTLLLIWAAIVLAIPKLSPMLAEIIYPIKSTQVVRMEKENVRANLEKELDTLRRQMFERIMTSHGADFHSLGWPPRNDDVKQAYEQYDREVVSLQKKYDERIAVETSQIDRDYANLSRVQEVIAVNLSRLSPLSCFTYVVTELSGTGLLELENFRDRAGRFQEQVSKTIYDNYITRRYGNTSGSTSISTMNKEGFSEKNVPVPHMSDYRHVTVTQALKTVWVDILLLALYTILFFAGAFVSFLRYDVR